MAMEKLMRVAFAFETVIVIVIVIGITIAASHAQADAATDSRPIGKIMSRSVDKVDVNKADKSVPMPCPRGSIEERFAESEGVPGFSYDYALGCMVDANHAGWIIRAGMACYDTAADLVADHNPKPGYCDDPLVRALPVFNLSGDFWEPKTPPYAMRYRLIKYAVGSNCQRADQRVHSEPTPGSANDRTLSLWLCEVVTTYDGMLNAAGLTEVDPRLFRTHEIVTLSSKKMEFDREGIALEPMFDFLVPKREYDCNLHVEGRHLTGKRAAGKRQLVCD